MRRFLVETGEEAVAFAGIERTDGINCDGRVQPPETLPPLIILVEGEIVGVDGVVADHVDGLVLLDVHAPTEDRDVVWRPCRVCGHPGPVAGVGGKGEEEAVLVEGDEDQRSVGEHGVALGEPAAPQRELVVYAVAAPGFGG
jgi:hypothetical protein